MPTFKLRDVEIEFPFKPYLVQIKYMESVIKSLQTGKNALLESPTGTGKTLCLLCATMAWRRLEIKKRTVEKSLIPDGKEPDYPLGWGSSDAVPEEEPEQSIPTAPKIIYASRTHSQLAQVVKELKRTAYAKDAKISILGSREQMCIHPEVSKQTNNTAMIHSCRNKVNKHLCHFYNNVENVRKAGSFTNEVLDIEELVALGKKRSACPYYAAREQSKEADCGIIFTPYNYLLDRKARRSHNLEVSGNVIIFDEAHNLEKMCEESASFDLTSMDIAKCIQETGELLKAAVNLSETGTVPDGYEAGESSALGEFNLQELATLKALFVHLESHLQAIPLSGVEKSLTKKGRYMFEFLAALSVNFTTHETIIDLVDKVVTYLSTLSNSFQTRGTALQKFSEILKIIFSAAGGQNPTLPSTLLNSNVATEMMMSELSKFYRVHIREDEVKSKNSWGGKQTFQTTTTESTGTQRTLSYWCFSPGYAMRDLLACGVKNLILTSGTLSPIESFTCELQVDFPITLQNTHVIDNHQVFVASLTKGLTGRRLESTYKTRGDYRLAQDIGNILIRMSRICPGGLLVFFPSYLAMEIYTKTWRELAPDIMRQIDLIKPCTIETRNKNGLKEAMEKYYSDVAKPEGGTFFAICRGKVSEGLDFSNENGRAVVIIGLPYPPSKDPKVRLKMEFLEDLRIGGANKVISGQEWYRLQALRAVNQAIGRVIRHRYDYGAILLMDYRYTKKDNHSELPKWIQPRVNQFDDAEKALRRVKSFFCSILEKEKIRLKQLSGDKNHDKENTECGEGTSGVTEAKKETIFFGGQQKKTDNISQYFAKSNDKISKTKNKTFLSIPKSNDLSNHIPSSVIADSCSLPQTTPNGSCTGCPTSSKRRRVSEDDDTAGLVPIKNFKKKTKGPMLLDALDKDVVQRPQEEPIIVEEEATNRVARTLLVMDKILDDQRRGLPKKKIKIVEKKKISEPPNLTVQKQRLGNPQEGVGERTQNSGNHKEVEKCISNDNTSESSTSVRNKQPSAEDCDIDLNDFSNWDEKRFIQGSNMLYLKATRFLLKGESYALFKSALINFKKDSSTLVPTLSKIFLDDERGKILFRAFVKFLPKKNTEVVNSFVKSCQEITGRRPEGF
uniref:regulator of telomere elongation helicase 1-like n=1 Tax=Styela clava TaxID=7725 RepID=UPI00193A1D19|nr:regulator of telomere elongation helicase 1-like [Styela clava]